MSRSITGWFRRFCTTRRFVGDRIVYNRRRTIPSCDGVMGAGVNGRFDAKYVLVTLALAVIVAIVIAVLMRIPEVRCFVLPRTLRWLLLIQCGQ
jgi:hypothetical protein